MIKRSKGEKAFNVFNIIILTFGALLFIMPYWLILSASFTDELTLLKSGGISLFPKKFSTYAYDFYSRPTIICCSPSGIRLK